MDSFIIASLISFFFTILVTPFMIRFAHRFGFVDKPNERKVHRTAMPRIGGVAFIIGTLAGMLFLTDLFEADVRTTFFILFGSVPLLIVGLLDDRFILKARYKLVAQLLTALIVVSSGLTIDFISIPFGKELDFGILSTGFTVFWLVAIMNSINLIDGLDGLAAGVSIIALATMLVLATGNPAAYGLVFAFGMPLIGSVSGFLFYNFHPAKLFMGDTGSLFLGYMIAVLSIVGLFKSVTMISLIIPLLILGVPIMDTFFAIIRRKLNKQNIGSPDKGHLHHCLLKKGYGHRQVVLTIYGVSILFACAALLMSMSNLWLSLLLLLIVTVLIQLFAEVIGLIGAQRQPLLNLIKRRFKRKNPKIVLRSK
ncbi:glycosyltransferase family 4 protein [Shouchella lehensis]|uniref:Undecaprenyl-phosphate N-acetylglucosaminyl 1-phosphate transferase n=1 Tax=Shouchella lehensis G1 TaxID=1246626 RepID=A0A060M7C0_9BACI|nr:MraY family glycosyltransferase [Shouchella lehensis]AIC96448.1 undecaprenyl-phosphate N-acetylglucosaminyl 1-phosphate transferase [Shouchella lehensis G1]